MAPIKLAYWKIRGLAQPIRILLGYTDTEFEDIRYECDDAPPHACAEWAKDKENLGLDFPNLPYLFDGDIKITQSNACLRYIGRKNKLDGESELEKSRVDMMESQAMDFRNIWVNFCYGGTKETLETRSVAYRKKCHDNYLIRFENFLNSKTFFAGDKVTFVDFPMYELLTQHLHFDAALLDTYPNLKAFLKRFEELPKIAAFLKSDKCFKGPMNNKQAIVNPSF